jgi:hypothetical protein
MSHVSVVLTWQLSLSVKFTQLVNSVDGIDTKGTNLGRLRMQQGVSPNPEIHSRTKAALEHVTAHDSPREPCPMPTGALPVPYRGLGIAKLVAKNQ